MISYAQNCEDVLIQRFFSGQQAQFYIDVGAGHHTYHNVTRHFYDCGWKGINIEPRRTFWSELGVHRPRDINLNCCVSNRIGNSIFYSVRLMSDLGPDNGGISTLDPELANRYRANGCQVDDLPMKIETLSSVCEQFGVTDIGFLKIDVEGHELSVVQGLEWRRWRPRLVIIERTLPFSTELAPADAVEWVQSMGYIIAFFDGLNQYLVRYEDRGLIPTLAIPANIFDQFIPHAQVLLQERIQHLEATLEAYKAKS